MLNSWSLANEIAFFWKCLPKTTGMRTPPAEPKSKQFRGTYATGGRHEHDEFLAGSATAAEFMNGSESAQSTNCI